MNNLDLEPNIQRFIKPREWLHNIIKNLNRKHLTIGLYLDVKAAFDKVWHEALKIKLTKQGFTLDLTNLIRSYLQDRTFNINYDCQKSTIRRVKSGVPQGSPITPTLYNIYVADIPKDDNIELSLYADNTAILTSAKKTDTAIKKLNKYLIKLEDWLDKWKISLNTGKTQLIRFSHGRLPPEETVKLQNNKLNWSNHIKYLGLTFDKRRTPRDYTLIKTCEGGKSHF